MGLLAFLSYIIFECYIISNLHFKGNENVHLWSFYDDLDVGMNRPVFLISPIYWLCVLIRVLLRNDII